MVAIPWWVWLGIGLFVTITSAVVGGTVKVFIWVGLIFLIVGLTKVVILFVMRPRETKADQKAMQMPQPQYQAPKVSYCSNCRVAVQSFDNFCRNCGTRLR